MNNVAHQRKLPLLLSAVLVASSSLSQVIVNGGFESGQLSPWFQGANYSNPSENPENWNVTSSDAHSGLYAATDVGNIELRQNFAPIACSSILSVSLWVRQPFGPALSSVYFHYSDSADQFIRLDTQTTGWEFFDLTSRLAPSRHLNGISFFGYSYGSPGRTVIDDIAVTLVPEPSITSVLSGFAVTALFFRWRSGRGGCSCARSFSRTASAARRWDSWSTAAGAEARVSCV